LKVVAADSNTVGGKKSVGTLVDELWLFGKMADAENMFREATGGLASRPEGFVIYLTTQSDEPPAGVFKQKLDYARDVRDGEDRRPRFVPIIYEHPPEMVKRASTADWRTSAGEPEHRVLGGPKFLEREFKKAETGRRAVVPRLPGEAPERRDRPGNLRSDRWAGADFWEQQATATVTLDA
jgi:phage terminase large subunit-like protein